MHSLHVGIVNFFPFIFGNEKRPEVIDRLFNMLEDQTSMKSQFGIRSLSVKD
jgi:hypothetical protein